MELPEEEICKEYLKSHSIKQVADLFQHDRDTIKKILYKHNIEIMSSGDQAILNNSKAVAQLDPNTNEIIKTYPSVREAERCVNANKHINDVCKGKRKTAGGYKWKYIEDLHKENLDVK